MQAHENRLRQLLDSTQQYIVPLFQRFYVWERNYWDTLWDDLVDLIEDDDLQRTHFLGSVVVIPAPDSAPGLPRFILIDGQQRIATLLVMLAALRDGARQADDTEGEISALHRRQPAGIPGAKAARQWPFHRNQLVRWQHPALLPESDSGDGSAARGVGGQGQAAFHRDAMSYGQANTCTKLIDLALYYRNPSPVSSGRGYLEVGRVGQPGTVRKMGFATEGEAWAAGERWRRRKVKRGYRAVGKAAACASVAVRRCSALSAGPWLANVHSGYHGFMDGHRSAI